MATTSITTLTDIEIAEAMRNDDWLLTCTDVELPDAERTRIRADYDALRAEQARRDRVHNAREIAQTVMP